MSFVILQAVMKRLEERRRARLFAELGSTMKLPRSGRGPAVARGHRAGRPRAAADDPDPGVPRAPARRRRTARPATGRRRRTRVPDAASPLTERPMSASAPGPGRARLVQGHADQRRGRAGDRRRVAAGAPGRRIALAPLADGGEGTLVAVEAAGGWVRRTARVHDPHRARDRGARGSRGDDGAAAFVEMAQASGLSRLTPERARRRPAPRPSGPASCCGP